ncbi:lysine-specific demethylase 5D [Prunus yedoensis var. nudiflora]|uniref:Lysine-specific demethylase 5D n=1 Tax=Prunus yedoensis var. nudiflora TaxID=2094558 RepID=A0A314XU05_PRUYE|nr:lysine-specific demethylase 5D [Prunus yedoensis var. nudiflora]
MNPVREMAKNLIRSQKWAEVFDAVPCYEPGHLNLKNYAEQARGLIQDIESAMSSCPKISELELLYSRACEFPIYVKESENLLQRISSAKVLMEGIRNCISEKRPAAIDVDVVYKLKLESSELQVQLPDIEKLSDLLGKAESCRARCGEILKDHISLKGGSNNAVMSNAYSKDGASLRIKVDQLSLVECELKKARCRKGAEGYILRERSFVDMSKHWMLPCNGRKSKIYSCT